MSAKLERAIVNTLYLIVLFSAFAHGVVEPWSFFFFELLTLVLFLMWAARAIVDRRVVLEIPVLIWPFAGLFLVGLIQSINWRDESGLRHSLSFDAEATTRTSMMIGALLVLTLIAANSFTHPKILSRFFRILIVFGATLSVLGLFQHFSGSRQIYWFRHAEAEAFGAFFNRNHFAGYLELILPLPVAFLATGSIRGEKMLLYGGAALFMGTAVVFTLSRAGMISVFVELLFLAGVVNRRCKILNLSRKLRYANLVKAALISLGLGASIFASVFWFGAESVINRVLTGDPNNSDLRRSQSFYSNRGEIWKDSVAMIRGNLLFGVGLGAFPTAYPQYTQNPLAAGAVAEAHNDFLQILTDAGIVGGVLAFGFMSHLFRAIARGLRTQDPTTAAIVIGGGTGLIGALVHSVFDYNLHLPSHATLFLFFSTAIARLQTVDFPAKEWSSNHPSFSKRPREALT